MHRVGSLLPVPGEAPKFAQIYVHDSTSEAQIQRRLSYHYDRLDDITLCALQATLRACNNPYYYAFLTAGERLRNNEHIALCLNTIEGSMTTDHRRYNRPTASEVAVIIPEGEQSQSTGKYRDLILQYRSGALQRISEIHSCYLPMRYPLIFPFGEQGFHLQTQLVECKLTIVRC